MINVFSRKVVQKIRHLIQISFYYKSYFFIKKYKQFAPNSAGNLKIRANITSDAICNTFEALLSLIGTHNLGIIELLNSHKDKTLLWDIFSSYWSDKATTHNYDIFYDKILVNPENIWGILEIGIGTNNTKIVSNMWKKWMPGASLRSFRDYLKNAQIYWADIDPNILISEDRIKTYFVDQTSTDSLQNLFDQIPIELDLIIDDWLHCPHANIKTLTVALKYIKKGGWIVIEDISLDSLPIWRIIEKLLPDIFTCKILHTKANVCLFAVQKNV